MNLIFLLFFGMLFSGTAAGQAARNDTRALPTDNPLRTALDSGVHAAAEDLFRTGHPAAVSIGIIRNGVSVTYNYGALVKGTPSLPSAYTIYPIASISKTFTGTLLAAAALEGKLRPNDDIRQYLPGEFPNLAFQGAPVMLKHLTNHRSGLPFLLPQRPEVLPGFENEAVPWPSRIAPIYAAYSRDDFYKDLREVTLDTVPGHRFRYSNAAVQLLCYILEGVYQQPFEQLLRDKITAPLQMDHTRITLSRSDSSQLAPGYDEAGKSVPWTPDFLSGAGSIKSTVNDMLKYINWNLKEEDATIQLAHRAILQAGDYSTGLNWQKLRSGPYTVVWQEGNIPGFNSYCVVYPGLNAGIVVLTNESDRNSSSRLSAMINRIMKGIESHAVALP